MRAPSSACILAIGDSLTAGYGLPADASFASQVQAGLNRGGRSATVRNAGISGDTTEDALRRLPELLAGLSRKPDLAIVELGANDVLRGIAPQRTRANLDRILQSLGDCGIPVLLATFEVPRFLAGLAARYHGMYAALAARHDAAVAPFFPPGVFGRRDMVLPDGLHPNARAIERIATAFLPAVIAALDRADAAAAA